MTTRTLLEIEDLTVRFGGVTAIDNATLGADSSRITGLIGPNGAGKTTLFNVVCGLLKPTSGAVYLANDEITGEPTHERARRGIARTFQRLEAFGSLSVWENVLVAAEIHHPRRPREIARELIERVGLQAYAQRQADTVPTGIARLLELARALAIDPALLLLDEPSSGLSGAETEAFGGLLRDLVAEGRAVLIVEHDIDLIMSVCDVIHVLDFGKVIASGSPAEIRADDNVQRAYLGQSDG